MFKISLQRWRWWSLFQLNHLWRELDYHTAVRLQQTIWIVRLKVCTYFWSNFNHNNNNNNNTWPRHMHTHTVNTTGFAGVCLVREEEWAAIRSCDPPVCLRLYHRKPDSSHTPQTDRWLPGKSGKVSIFPLVHPTTRRSIYIPIFQRFLCRVNSRRRKLQFSYINYNM